MELGAEHGDIVRLVVTRGLKLNLAGVVLGIAGTLAATRQIAGMLFGVSATDPTTLAAIAVLLTLVALAACWIPARRAMHVDPTVALRYE